MTVPRVCLDAGDAVELGELLGFIGDWLLSDRERLAESLRRFVGVDGYDIEQLRGDCPGSGSCSVSPTGNCSSAVMSDDGDGGTAGRRAPGRLAPPEGFVG